MHYRGKNWILMKNSQITLNFRVKNQTFKKAVKLSEILEFSRIKSRFRLKIQYSKASFLARKFKIAVSSKVQFID